jgi:hypothetical protein
MFPWALLAGGVWFVMVLLFVLSLCLAAKMDPASSIAETHQLKIDEEVLPEPGHLPQTSHSSLPPVMALVEISRRS